MPPKVHPTPKRTSMIPKKTTLPRSFLAKLDMVQRQMGLQPTDFVPVKYVNDQERQMQSFMFNLMFGLVGLGAFYSIFKGRSGGIGGKAGKNVKKTGKSDKGGGGWFGGGGGSSGGGGGSTYYDSNYINASTIVSTQPSDRFKITNVNKLT